MRESMNNSASRYLHAAFTIALLVFVAYGDEEHDIEALVYRAIPFRQPIGLQTFRVSRVATTKAVSGQYVYVKIVGDALRERQLDGGDLSLKFDLGPGAMFFENYVKQPFCEIPTVKCPVTKGPDRAFVVPYKVPPFGIFAPLAPAAIPVTAELRERGKVLMSLTFNMPLEKEHVRYDGKKWSREDEDDKESEALQTYISEARKQFFQSVNNVVKALGDFSLLK